MTTTRCVIISISIFCVTLTGCGKAAPSSTSLPVPTATLIPIEKSCGYDYTVKAWIDENADGVWDKDELPLPDIEVNVSITIRDGQDYGRRPWITNDEGEARVYIDWGGQNCRKAELEAGFVVYPEVPERYRLTTDAQVLIDRSLGWAPNLSFGFALDASTATPQPEGVASADIDLRAGPSANYPKTGMLHPGEKCRPVAVTSDGLWYQIELQDGTRTYHAWVEAASITIIGAALSLPTVSPQSVPPEPPGPTDTPSVLE